MSRRIGVAAVCLVALLGVAMLVRLASLLGEPRPQPAVVTEPLATPIHETGSPPAQEGWRVAHQLSAHHILVLEVETERLDEAKAIAAQLVEPVRDRYSEIVVYFYRPGQRGKLADRRVQWTPRGGYVLVLYNAQN